jgi:hypothetical protein
MIPPGQEIEIVVGEDEATGRSKTMRVKQKRYRPRVVALDYNADLDLEETKVSNNLMNTYEKRSIQTDSV